MGDPVLDAFKRQPQSNDDDRIDTRRLDAYRFTRQSPCYTCHGGNRDQGGFKLSLTGFDNPRGFGLDGLKAGNGDAARLVELLGKPSRRSPLEMFEKGDPTDKTIQVLGRMPDLFSLKFADKKLTLKTDFAKAFEAVPTVQLDENARKILSSVKEVSLEGKQFTLDLSQRHSIPVNKEIALIGQVTDVTIGDANNKFKLSVDFDKDKQRVALKDIEGVTVNVRGSDGKVKSLAIHEVALDTSGKSPILRINIDNPIACPFPAAEKNWPKTVTVPIDLGRVVSGINADFVKGLVKTLADAKTSLENKDASMFLSGIPDEGLRDKLHALLKGVTSVTKTGDRYEILRDNGVVKQDFGGPDVRVSPRVSFKLGKDSERPSISNIEGVNFTAPLPSELHLGDRFYIGLKGVELGPKYANGSRTLSVKTDNILDDVKITLGPDMKPVTDSQGNWSARITVVNPLAADGRDNRLTFNLRFDKDGKPNMTAEEILDITSRATAQGVDFSFAGGGMAVMSGASGAAADVVRVAKWIRSWFD